MELHSFDELLALSASKAKKCTMAVVGAGIPSAIDAALYSSDNGIADSILVGDQNDISALLRERNRNPDDFCIVQNPAGETAAETAVKLVKEGKANFLLKGLIETSDLFHPIVKKENGLRTDRVMSHVAFYQLSFYHKLLITTDGGICAYPDLVRKKDILLNAVDTLHLLGYEKPKVAVLACKEHVDPNMPETQDAYALKQMCESGELGDCYVEGPISYDLALSKERAEIKHYDDLYCGDFDILISPNIHAGNILGKCLELFPGTKMASYVAGAKIPIVLTSRAASADEKMRCIALAGIIASEKSTSHE